MIEAQQPRNLIHLMPDAWNRPRKWTPLGRLTLKSEAAQIQILELGGQTEGGEMRSTTVELPLRTRVEVQSGFFSFSYVHNRSNPEARIGIRAERYKEIRLIGAQDWGNIWVYGMDIRLAEYIAREEFSRRARFVQTGSRLFPHNESHGKSLAVPFSELKPLSELFE